jgi:hypothetical protein
VEPRELKPLVHFGVFELHLRACSRSPIQLRQRECRAVSHSIINTQYGAWTPDGRSIFCTAGTLLSPGLWRAQVSANRSPERMALAKGELRRA